MTFPFEITQDLLDAVQQHQSYISAGQRWLLRNDAEGQNEQVLLEEIVTQIQHLAEQHFGDDEEGYDEFCDDVGLDDITGGEWYDIVDAAMEVAE